MTAIVPIKGPATTPNQLRHTPTTCPPNESRQGTSCTPATSLPPDSQPCAAASLRHSRTSAWEECLDACVTRLNPKPPNATVASRAQAGHRQGTGRARAGHRAQAGHIAHSERTNRAAACPLVALHWVTISQVFLDACQIPLLIPCFDFGGQ